MPPNVVIENQEITTVTIKHAMTGTTERVPVKQEVIALNAATGERMFQTNTDLTASLDGRIIKPEERHYCHDCQRGPYSSQAVAYCATCQAVLCRERCAKDKPLCKRHRWIAFLGSLFRIGGKEQ